MGTVIHNVDLIAEILVLGLTENATIARIGAATVYFI